VTLRKYISVFLSIIITLSIMAFSPIIKADAAAAAPVITTKSQVTKATSLTVAGTAAAGSAITITGGASTATGIAGTDGKFSLNVNLYKNRVNNLYVTANGGAGASLFIIQDMIAPKAPLLYTASGTTEYTSIVLSGTAEAGSVVSITGGVTNVTGSASSGGVFGISVPLKADSDNSLSVTCTDAAGNKSPTTTVTIKQKDDAPLDTTKPVVPKLTTLAQITRASSIAVAGTAEADSTVKVTGGLGNATYTTTADENGNFSVNVVLILNQDNKISVTSTDKSGNVSDAASVDITQDIICPTTPVISTAQQTTAETSIDIEGTAEANSTVTISGGSASVQGTADGSGNFKITVELNKVCDNILYAVAKDKAGNESTASSVKITQESSPNIPTISTPSQTTTDSRITVKGTAAPGSTVSITGGSYVATGTAGGDGSYSIDVSLNTGVVNTLYVAATDAAGVVSAAATLVITQKDYSTIPTITTPSQWTNNNTMTITGTAKAGSRIKITGGKEVEVEKTNYGGGYSISVKLVMNTVNILRVSAVDDNGVESDANTVVITQGTATDTTAPGFVLTMDNRYVVSGATKYFNASIIKASGSLNNWYLIVVTTLDDGTQSITSTLYGDNQTGLKINVNAKAVKSTVYVSDSAFTNSYLTKTYSLTGFVYN
jgi:large repetitive protein